MLKHRLQVPASVPHVVFERRGFLIEATIDEAMEALYTSDFFQSHTFLVERLAIQFFFKRDALQFTVSAEAPAVIAANETFSITCFCVYQRLATVTTNVQESTNRTVVLPGDDNLINPHFCRNIVARGRNQAVMSQEKPVPSKNGFQFALEKFFVAMNQVFLGQPRFTHQVFIFVIHIFT
ncbi:hypothetical protein A9C11_06365 [Pseudomonas citronellolis]|uniref:Uncharacterized protein n=1 Tax=Pseudomonas citronellolis TaxID=53408 RepID=A0A1A9K973_9PSED|nr:hypothetical protein A9C11_06365 [Pseudomonas citronellolis]